MDRNMELDHLALAEKAVAESERHIEREEQLISDLDRAGHDTALARATLETLRLMRAEHVAHRNLLLKMLGENRGSNPIFRPGQSEPVPEPEQTLRARNCNRHP